MTRPLRENTKLERLDEDVATLREMAEYFAGQPKLQYVNSEWITRLADHIDAVRALPVLRLMAWWRTWRDHSRGYQIFRREFVYMWRVAYR